MEVERRIFGNTLQLATGQVISQIANFGFIVLFARTFGASTLGAYSLAMAIGGLACSVVSFGTNALTLRQISREPDLDRQIIGTVLPFQLLTGITTWSLLALGAYWFTEEPAAWHMITLVAAFHIMLVWQTLLLNRFKARQLMQFVAIAQIGNRAGVLMLGCLAILTFRNATLAVASLPISVLLVSALVYWSGTSRFGFPVLTFSTGKITQVIRSAWPFMSIAILAVLYERLGVIFLRVFQSDAAVGYFASADRLIVPFIMLFAVFTTAVFPALSRLSAEQSMERDALARRCLRVLLAILFPTATMVYLFRNDIIFLLYGEGFGEATAVLTILAWAIALRGFNSFLSMFKISEDLQNRLSLLKLSAVLVFVVLCLLLIPRFSYIGLAYAMIVADAFLSVMMQASLRNKNLLPDIGQILWPPALCCFIMIIVTVNLSDFGIAIRFGLSVLTFMVTAVLTGTIKYHDVAFLKNVMYANRERASGS